MVSWGEHEGGLEREAGVWEGDRLLVERLQHLQLGNVCPHRIAHSRPVPEAVLGSGHPIL